MKELHQHLKLGLIAMSNSLEKGFWLHGHIGAEILTNTFYIIELEPGIELRKAIIQRIKRIYDSKQEYFDYKGTNDSENHNTILIEGALMDSVSKLSVAGHGVIFGTLALKAIRYLDGWLPKKIHDGLLSMLKNTTKDYPERYFKYFDYQNIQIDSRDIPVFENVDSAAKYCISHQIYYENQKIDGKSYFFHGNQLHEITHAQALVMLDELGYVDMAKKGLKQLSKQIKLGSVKPPRGIKYQNNEVFNPNNPSFWKRDVEDEHHFKLAYSISFLIKKYPELRQNEILEKVSGHWELMN